MIRSERLTRALNLADQVQAAGFDRIAKDLRSEALDRADREWLATPGKEEIKLINSLDLKFKDKEPVSSPIPHNNIGKT